MIIKVEQTREDFKNRFEITVNDQKRYLAGTPWMKMDIPLDADRIRRCVLTDPAGNILFKTDYSVVQNVSNTAIPMKWLFTGKQKSLIYQVLDGNGAVCGTFYKLTKAFLDSRYVIQYKDYKLRCYDVSVGDTRHLSVYDKEKQIAEIVKPLSVENNLDFYLIFLLDEFADTGAVLSFFTVLFDYLYYSGSGEVVVHKKEVSVRYSYSRNNKFYNKNWIAEHFRDDSARLLSEIQHNREKMLSDVKRQAKKILLMIACFWGVALIVVLIILYLKFGTGIL